MSTKILMNVGTQASDSGGNEKRVFPTRFFLSSQHRRNSTKQDRFDEVDADPAIVKLIRDGEGMINHNRTSESARNRRVLENKNGSAFSNGNAKPRTLSFPGSVAFSQNNRNNMYSNRSNGDNKVRRNGGYFNGNRGWTTRQRTLSSNNFRNQPFPFYNNYRRRSRSHYVTFFDPYFRLCGCYLPRNYNYQRMLNQNFRFNQRGGFFPPGFNPNFLRGRRYSFNGRFYNQTRRGQQQRPRTKSEGKAKQQQQQQQQSNRPRRRAKSNVSESAVSDVGQNTAKQTAKSNKRTKSNRRRRNIKPKLDVVVKNTLSQLTKRVSAELSKANAVKEEQQLAKDSQKDVAANDVASLAATDGNIAAGGEVAQ